MLMWVVILLVLFLALGGGGYGYSRYGFVGVSPFGLILVVFALLYFTGNLPSLS